MAKILVTKPGVLNQRDRAALRRADVIAVEAESPADVKLIHAEGELSGSGLLFAAVSALNTTGGFASDAREAFARAVMAELTAEREARSGE